MILNRFEKAIMNNRLRAWVQRKFEAKKLLSIGGPMSGGIALEVGCGAGVGSDIIFKCFKADKIDAFDLDPEMARLAQKRLSGYGARIKITQGDLTGINSSDNHYDAVFDFTAIHHVPKWRDAIREIYRVLKPGGRFYCEEVLERAITGPIARRLFDHPQEDRFSHDQFIEFINESGFTIIGSSHDRDRFGFYVADK